MEIGQFESQIIFLDLIYLSIIYKLTYHNLNAQTKAKTTVNKIKMFEGPECGKSGCIWQQGIPSFYLSKSVSGTIP